MFSIIRNCCRVPSRNAALVKIFDAKHLKNVNRFNASLAPTNKGKRVVGLWLFGCSGMVFGAVSIGGLTRLTESGLSIVEWNLIKGMKPPLNEQEWQAEFEKYKQYPEYSMKSHEMTLQEFKFIFHMEYLHRMWGRAIGMVYLLPAAFFWYRGYFNPAMKKRIAIGGALLLFQGMLGWYMVKSGLDLSNNSDKHVPRVSQYRLAAHLTSAFVLYAILLRAGLVHVLPIYNHNAITGIGGLRALAHTTKGAMLMTAVVGAFVAGLDAGLVYNGWPKFAGKWIPEDLWTKSPAWRNFTENPTMVQFIHRNLAYMTVATATVTLLAGRRLALSRGAKRALYCFAIAGYSQAMVGILTLIHYVPTWLASLHQNGFMIMLTTAVWLTTEIRRVPIK